MPRLQGRSAVNALFKGRILRQTLAKPTRAKGRDHDPASRHQTRRRPADTAASPRKTGDARALARPAAADVGYLQARDGQGNLARAHREGGAARPDRLA